MTQAALGASRRTRTFETFAIAARRATRSSRSRRGRSTSSSVRPSRRRPAQGVNLGPGRHGRRRSRRAADVRLRRRFAARAGFRSASSGKVVSLLSGGIDSPVATYRILQARREGVLVHFHSAPFTDRSSVRKATELARDHRRVARDDDALSRPARRRAAADRRGGAAGAPRRALPPAHGARSRREIAAARRGQGARDRRQPRPGRVADAREHRVRRRRRPMPVLRPLIGDDKQEIVDGSAAHRDVRDVDPSVRGLLLAVRPAFAGDARVDRRVPRRRSGARHRRARGRVPRGGRDRADRRREARLAIVGAGMMGEALARGLFAAGWSPDDLVLADVRERAARARSANTLGVETSSDAADAAAKASGVLFAVKPQDAAAALERIAGVRRHRTDWSRSSPG